MAVSDTTGQQQVLTVNEWQIRRVKPYKENPRRISDRAVEGVAASIREFGWQQPLVVDKAGVLIVGHARLLAAKQLGLKTVPVVVADLTPDQAKAYRLADNKTGELAEWDWELLGQELAALAEVDMGVFGFDWDPGNLDHLFDSADPHESVETAPRTATCPECGHQFEL